MFKSNQIWFQRKSCSNPPKTVMIYYYHNSILVFSSLLWSIYVLCLLYQNWFVCTLCIKYLSFEKRHLYLYMMQSPVEHHVICCRPFLFASCLTCCLDPVPTSCKFFFYSITSLTIGYIWDTSNLTVFLRWPLLRLGKQNISSGPIDHVKSIYRRMLRTNQQNFNA